jgi:capsular polysaccharide export protein
MSRVPGNSSKHRYLPSAMTFETSDGSTGLLEAPIGGRRKARSGVPEAAALVALLSDFSIQPHVSKTARDRLSGVVAWCDSRRRGERRAAALGVPFLLLGPGLLRAPPGWGRPAPMISAIAHLMTGPRSPADILEPGRLLVTRGWKNPELLARAARTRRDIVSRRLGGSWWNASLEAKVSLGDGRIALIVAGEGGGFGGDGMPSPALLRAMLAAALAENAPSKIVVLAPDRADRNALLRGLLREAASRGCAVLTRPVDPWEAIERTDCVYAAGGEIGFLSLLAGTRVRSFADSFYSGWGITTDEAGVAQKPFHRTVDEVFAGACLVATRCLDPYRNRLASFEEVVEILDEWRKIEAVNRRIVACLGMSFWKRRRVADFFRSSRGPPVFRRTTRAALARARVRSGGAIAVWASRAPSGLAKEAERHGIPLIRVEDGFIRSVGLGSDFMPPASLVLDSRGMHFDPSVRSDLERLLREAEFDANLIERSRGLIAQLVAGGVTKYNLGKQALSIEWPADRRRVLVPGQVEDDLSVRLGGEGVSGNLDLLNRVRTANPDAYILYKPHPDVEAGHRKGRIPDESARRFADVVIRQVSTAAVLGEVDELHTLTSLAGFEALLRRRRVVVYGRPFYAGWGLTADLAGIDRGRRLTLEELVAGVLILYPRYLDPVTRLPCGPEIIIERLRVPELWRPGMLVAARQLQGVLARCWSEIAGRSAKFPVGGLPPPGRDQFRTPQL